MHHNVLCWQHIIASPLFNDHVNDCTAASLKPSSTNISSSSTEAPEALLRQRYCCSVVQLTVYNAVSYRKVPELIKANEAHSRGLAVIKRFTGGGTVVVDKDTIFTTLIMSVSL